MRIASFILGMVLAAITQFAFTVGPAQAKSVHSEFSEAWKARDGQYVNQRDELDKKARDAAAAFFAAMSSNAPDLLPKQEAMVDTIDAVAYVDGRGSRLRELRMHMEKKPSAERTELWMQGQIDQMQTARRHADTRLAHLRQIAIGKDGMTFSQFFGEVEATIVAVGQTRGAVDELQLIDQNLASYYRARSQEQTERRLARARILGAIGAALQQSSNAPTMRAPWHATCSTFGNRTNCTGN